MNLRPGRGAVADVVAVLGAFLVVGVVCGVIWWLVVDPAEFTRTANGGGTMGEVELSKRFNTDGWYSVIAIVAGFLSGLGVTWWRSRDFRLTTALLVPGAALAAAVMALVGWALGPGDPRVALLTAPRGAMVPVELVVSARPSYLLWPITVLLGALMVLWSSSASDEVSAERWPAGPAGQGDLEGPAKGAEDEAEQSASNSRRSGG